MLTLPDVRDIVALALAEDLGVSPERFSASAPPAPALLDRDITTAGAVDPDARFAGRIVAREACTVAGLPVVQAAFDQLSAAVGLFEPVDVFPLLAEGGRVESGTAVMEIEGLARVVLAAERTALDFLMLLSGIATETSRWVAAAGPDLAVCDTRKTVPGLRDLSKYAVAVGGGTNHRAGLYDMGLLKDNHIAAAGSIASAVEGIRGVAPGVPVEVEAERLEQALEAVEAGADLVLLDNMDDDTLAKVVSAVNERAGELGRTVLTEASGNVRFERLAALRRTGVDRVSTSALTMGFRPVDFGLDEA